MQFGIALPAIGPLAGPENIRRVAQHAEQLGYASVWLPDHVLLPARVESKYPYTRGGEFRLGWQTPFYDPLATLGFLAGVTERVRLGTSVLVLPYRNPVVTAKTLATIDALSGGRLVLGVGVGWMAEEFDGLGLPAGSYAARGALTDEAIQVFRAIWRDGLSSYQGKHVQFQEVGAYPKPVQPGGIPIWIGGNSGPALRRAARLGDGWHAIALDLADFRRVAGRLREEIAAAGRPEQAVTISIRSGVVLLASGEPAPGLDREPGQTIMGEAASVRDQIAAYGEAGVAEMLITFRAGEDVSEILRQMDRFAPLMG